MKTHGQSKTLLYNAWQNMIKRCDKPSCKSYKYYGGRGIKVCKRWYGFVNFHADMGDRPTPKHTLDRINNNGDYKPSNCRWVTQAQQNLNTRRSVFISYKGVTKTMVEWGRETGIKRGTIRARLKRGWSVKDTLTRIP